MAQWIRRWSTEPEILGSIPSEVVPFSFVVTEQDEICVVLFFLLPANFYFLFLKYHQ